MKSYIYSIADLNFTLAVPKVLDVEALLPTMRVFRVTELNGLPIFSAKCVERLNIDMNGPKQLLEQAANDMGRVRIERISSGYLVSISYYGSQYIHYMHIMDNFARVELQMQWQDRTVGHLLSSLLRIAFAQALIMYNGISIHGSAVMINDSAYLFLGKSGTGKSTHSSLWLNEFRQCELLNDDNPVIRIVDDNVYIYGTPWSGKTPCYKNKRCQLQGVVRLEQFSSNIFLSQQGVAAFVTLLPGCLIFQFDSSVYNGACDVISKIVERVTVGRLQCLPDLAAAHLCYDSIKNKMNN